MRLFIYHKDDFFVGAKNALRVYLYGGIIIVGIVVVVSLCTGCSGVEKFVGTGVPSIVIYQYHYQMQPPALAPDTPPSPPPIRATDLPPLPVVNYQTVYPSVLDDPTLVIFKNDSYQKIRIEIDDAQQSIRLGPYAATANIHLGPGEHKVRITTERPTQFGVFDWVTFSKINIELNGRSQIIHLSGN